MQHEQVSDHVKLGVFHVGFCLWWGKSQDTRCKCLYEMRIQEMVLSGDFVAVIQG